MFFKHRTVGPTALETLEERVAALEAQLGPRTLDAQARTDFRALLGFEGMSQEQIDRLRADMSGVRGRDRAA